MRETTRTHEIFSRRLSERERTVQSEGELTAEGTARGRRNLPEPRQRLPWEKVAAQLNFQTVCESTHL